MTILHDSKPIYLQIKNMIEDQIVNEQLQEHDQIPSTTQMVHFYKINHITAAKGINLLVDKGIIYKRRGVGMFVADGARSKLIQDRKNAFADSYVLPMIQEAKKLGLTDNDVSNLINFLRERDEDES
nr:GntR family transcriptional regulator [Candidatus Contubernalis alkalaceticus]